VLSGHFTIKADLTWTYNDQGEGQKLFDAPTNNNRFDINIAPDGSVNSRPYMDVRVDGVLGAPLQSGVKQTLEIFRDATHSDQNDKELQWVGRRFEDINGNLFYLESALHSLEVIDPTGTTTNNYPAAYPDGTGTIWEDSVSGNTARQVGTWPADNSEWVSDEPHL